MGIITIALLVSCRRGPAGLSGILLNQMYVGDYYELNEGIAVPEVAPADEEQLVYTVLIPEW